MSDRKLGKQAYSFSEKTLRLGPLITKLDAPPRYDFDQGRAPFPLQVLGNDEWGNCVKVGQANEILRLERAETRSTAKISTDDVVREYKSEQAREFGHSSMMPGDNFDQGLVMRLNLTNWRKFGFTFGAAKHNFTIDAFGELDPENMDQIRAAVYHLHGVQFGFALPLAAQQMTNEGTWDYHGEMGAQWKPGSWGGHCVFTKAYQPGGFEVLTWGIKVIVTEAFVMKYCDEAWAVVDALDSWRVKESIDVKALRQWLRDIGASNITTG